MLCSLVIGVCNLLFGKDPVFDGPAKKAAKVVSMGKLMEQIWKMMKIPTFALIIIQVAFCLHAHHITLTIHPSPLSRVAVWMPS